MTTKEIWGPPLWRLLHSLAERLGRQTILLLATDEKRAWTNLLKVIGQVMPCLACRNHYREWIARNPLEKFLRSNAIQEDARRWVWALHNEVNLAKGIASPPFETLHDLYGSRTSQEMNEDYKQVIEVFKLAVQQRIIQPELFMTFKVRMVSLRQIIG